jgi:hypothetical protein
MNQSIENYSCNKPSWHSKRCCVGVGAVILAVGLWTLWETVQRGMSSKG